MIILLLMLVGCHDDPPDSMTSAILAALAAADALAAQRKKAGTRFSYYAKKRVQWLVGENTSLGLPPYTTLTARIGAEIDAVATYLDAKVGTPAAPGPLGGATDANPTPHTDLSDVAKIDVDDSANEVLSRTGFYTSERGQRVQRIVWRAAAIHHELWTGSDTDPTTTLDATSMDLLLDRRLRMVERLLYTDDTQHLHQLQWTITSGTGPWTDNRRTVLNEYPFVQLKQPFLDGVAAAGLNVATLNGDFTDANGQLRYNVSNSRFRPPAAPHWSKVNPTDYGWKLTPQGISAGAAFDLLLPNTSPVDPSFVDFWNRNWMFCDHMLAALHLDALRFGLRRLKGSDQDFNAAAGSGAYLTPLMSTSGAPDPSDLLYNGGTYFDGATTKPGDLQVGDHVVFWNSYFVRVILRSDFGLENSVITAVDGDDARKAVFAGHGMGQKDYASFADDMVEEITTSFDTIRGVIVQTIGSTPNASYLPLSIPAAAILWAPYGETFHAAAANMMQVPGAWWLRIQLKDTNDDGHGALSQTDALRLFPKSVAIDLNTQTPPANCPDHASDYSESIYLPLSIPNATPTGWPAYFAGRAAGTQTATDVALDDVKVDGDWVVGLYYNGPASKTPVMRPKAVVG